ncbi:BQ5605_C002g01520 [Microbotryum silenes-dioicae]|uniref:BQ5605_C002g01520 protein n=1 Tax=Microbotryum silenes-dioicae TaxID=796604 RepID=A0A2X0M3E8_9BASI|nr:BQ5605_C002g01520 [Microbotryum silenes-dioicae]
MVKAKVASTTTTPTTARDDRTSSKRLIWPAFIPPDLPLELTAVLPSILIIDSFLDPASIKRWHTFLPSLPFSPSPPRKRGEAYRTNDRYSKDDPDLAHNLWTRTGLKEICQKEIASSRPAYIPMGLSSNIRVYKYGPDAEFGPHYDDDSIDSRTGWRSEWTLLVYLSGQEDGVVGGETTFYPSPSRKGNGQELKVGLKRGRALLHKHGRDCMLHSGLKVQQGVKWVLRSDVLFGPSSAAA